MKPETAKALQELVKAAAKSQGFEGEVIMTVNCRTEEVPEYFYDIHYDDYCSCESCEAFRLQLNCQHDFKEVYYGHECVKCQSFYAFGQAPWDDYDEDNEDDFDYQYE